MTLREEIEKLYEGKSVSVGYIRGINHVLAILDKHEASRESRPALSEEIKALKSWSCKYSCEHGSKSKQCTRCNRFDALLAELERSFSDVYNHGYQVGVLDEREERSSHAAPKPDGERPYRAFLSKGNDRIDLVSPEDRRVCALIEAIDAQTNAQAGMMISLLAAFQKLEYRGEK